MFDNSGAKLMVIAKVFFWIIAIGSAIGAIRLWTVAGNCYYSSDKDTYTALGFVCLIVGPLLAWLSSLGLYAFGQLVDDGQHTRYFAQSIYEKMAAAERNERIEKSAQSANRSTSRPVFNDDLPSL